ncbi:MAG: sulfur carrier protein ThiS [Sulfuricurvum sp.]
MIVIINGETREVTQGSTLYDVIHLLGVQERVMAAAVNMEIVKQDQWEKAVLRDQDRIELLDFVGGG